MVLRDTDGKIMNDAWYKGATRFSGGKAWVVAENTAPVLIDTKGNKLSEVREALRVYSYTEGLAMALVKDEKTGRTLYGYLDGKGKWAIKPQFEECGRVLGRAGRPWRGRTKRKIGWNTDTSTKAVRW